MITPDFLKRVLIARFRRHTALVESTVPAVFDELPETVATHIVSEAALAQSELPVLASVFSSDEWTLLTTSRLIVSSGGVVRAMQHSEMDHVWVDVEACARDGPLETRRLAYILLTLRSGESLTIHVHPGKTFLGLQSALTWLVRQEHRRSSEAGSTAPE